MNNVTLSNFHFDQCFGFIAAPVLIGDNQMRDMTVTEGNNATFRCEPMSLPEELPPTQPLWKKNGVNLEFDEGRIESKNRKEDKKIMMPFINIYTILILFRYLCIRSILYTLNLLFYFPRCFNCSFSLFKYQQYQVVKYLV